MHLNAVSASSVLMSSKQFKPCLQSNHKLCVSVYTYPRPVCPCPQQHSFYILGARQLLFFISLRDFYFQSFLYTKNLSFVQTTTTKILWRCQNMTFLLQIFRLNTDIEYRYQSNAVLKSWESDVYVKK